MFFHNTNKEKKGTDTRCMSCSSHIVSLWSEIHVAQWYTNMYLNELRRRTDGGTGSATALATPALLARVRQTWASQCSAWYQVERGKPSVQRQPARLPVHEATGEVRQPLRGRPDLLQRRRQLQSPAPRRPSLRAHSPGQVGIASGSASSV